MEAAWEEAEVPWEQQRAPHLRLKKGFVGPWGILPRQKEKPLESDSDSVVSDPMNCSLPGSLSTEFSKQECWSGLPFPTPGDHPDPGIEPGSPTLQADSLLSEVTREALDTENCNKIYV